jgi:hypothetical protein
MGGAALTVSEPATLHAKIFPIFSLGNMIPSSNLLHSSLPMFEKILFTKNIFEESRI